MKSKFINSDKLWGTFNKLFKKIEQARATNQLDQLDDQVDAWNIQLESSFSHEQSLIDALCFILRDEIERSEKKSTSPRGKGRKPNWQNDLARHSQRLAVEKLVVGELVDTINERKTVDVSKWEKILESFQFSIELVAENIEAVEKQTIVEGLAKSSEYFQTMSERKQFLQDSQALLKNVRK